MTGFGFGRLSWIVAIEHRPKRAAMSQLYRTQKPSGQPPRIISDAGNGFFSMIASRYHASHG